MRSYFPLFCRSNFSFLEGASHPHELFARCAAEELEGLALCDRDGVYGAVRAFVASKTYDKKLITGASLSVDGVESSVLVLARNAEGYANLCRVLSKGRLRCEKGECNILKEELLAHSEGLYALLPPRFLLHHDHETLAHDIRNAFGKHLSVLPTRHRNPQDIYDESVLRALAKSINSSVAAGSEVLYHHHERRPLHDIVSCLRKGATLSNAGTCTKPSDAYALLSDKAFKRLWRDDESALEETLVIADACHFSLASLRYVYPSEALPDGKTSAELLRELTFVGARRRYDECIPDDVRAQIEKELSVIEELEYCGYFLTMYDIVEFCKSKEIMCQGRGSAANSAVCFCLGVTAVDPARVELLFERFLSKERNEPPDIDLDIMHERREEVIQYVYQKYGRKHAAMVCNIIRYRTKSAIRDVGKVLDIPATSLDRLAKLSTHYGGLEEDAFERAGFPLDIKANRHLLHWAKVLKTFPRHLGIHPGGFLLGHVPVHDLVPIENATMQDRTVIQWDKDDIEELALFKVDLLGLGALTQLDLGFRLIEKHHGQHLSMATIPACDDATYDMICEGDTIGVFQIESRAQMSMLPRLKPRSYYDLVIEVSIVRPGPITGGMVHPYLRRRNGEEPVTFPHECLEPVLAKTLGVPLFQEQVMKLAVVAADYTPGEADQLRRDMAAWKKSGRIEHHRERLISRMKNKGIEEAFAERVFEQIKGFGEYGFPESHAASFALIAYATSFMKCHYPAAFCCSLLNAQPMGFYASSTIVSDARRHGVTVLPICVTHSMQDCTLEVAKGGHSKKEGVRPAVRMGFRYCKGLSENEGERIEAVRQKGAFLSVDDFAHRTNLGERALTTLAESGAFDSLSSSRRQALWNTRSRAREKSVPLNLRTKEKKPRFKQLSIFEEISWDYAASSHSTRGHPLQPLRTQMKARGWPSAKEVSLMKDKRKASYAGVVICRQRPGTARGVTFMTLEDETGFVNVVVWKNVFERFSILVKTQPFVGVHGEIQRSTEGIVHLIAKEIWVPDLKAKVPATKSYDFH